MTAVVVIVFAMSIIGTGIALVRMNRMSCLPCESGDESAYCDVPRPRRPS
jgi:hypothetical protein